MKGLTISQLAKAVQVNIATIRFYERAGLIAKPARSASGYRLYSDDFVNRIRAIIKAKSLGFTLEEIAELLALQNNLNIPCKVIKTRTADKIQAIEEKIRSLQKMKMALQQLHDQCQNQNTLKDCPLLDCLNNPNDECSQ